DGAGNDDPRPAHDPSVRLLAPTRTRADDLAVPVRARVGRHAFPSARHASRADQDGRAGAWLNDGLPAREGAMLILIADERSNQEIIGENRSKSAGCGTCLFRSSTTHATPIEYPTRHASPSLRLGATTEVRGDASG